MKKIFLSADIEGTCGIAHWDETENGKIDYPPFAEQMSREVAAACEGAVLGGADELLVKDAHDSARNIKPGMLPECASIFRGWGSDLMSMMGGLDNSFYGAMFTGYHSAASWDGNPLSHTMNTQNNHIKINGQVCSELMMNSMTAAMLGVPVLMATGDRMLCEWFQTQVPNALIVPVSEGRGRGSISMHPDKAVRLIRETAERAMALDATKCMYPMPEHFTVEVNYKQHYAARSASFFPGAKQQDSRTVIFECAKWADALAFFHFCL